MAHPSDDVAPCPVCQWPVDNPKAHEGYNCAEWPSQQECAAVFGDPRRDRYEAEVTYKDFKIGRPLSHHGYEWVHKDYDGPEDNRAGHSYSLVGCFMDIDERDM